jgi:hypothetical protein
MIFIKLLRYFTEQLCRLKLKLRKFQKFQAVETIQKRFFAPENIPVTK